MNRQRNQLAIDQVVLGHKVEARLKEHPAVVLERLARGGGSTHWYYCTSDDDLPRIAKLVHHGSVVSFFFDDRLRVVSSKRGVLADLLELLQSQKEVIAGILRSGGHQFDVDYLTGKEEITAYLDDAPANATLMYGAFPGRDNDGHQAITITVPDLDGVTRNHPH
jgi:hypothetical protein